MSGAPLTGIILLIAIVLYFGAGAIDYNLVHNSPEYKSGYTDGYEIHNLTLYTEIQKFNVASMESPDKEYYSGYIDGYTDREAEDRYASLRIIRNDSINYSLTGRTQDE